MKDQAWWKHWCFSEHFFSKMKFEEEIEKSTVRWKIVNSSFQKSDMKKIRTATPWPYSPCRTLASFTTIFQSSLLCAPILQFVTPILLRSSLKSSIHLNLGLPTFLLPSGVFWCNLYTTLSSLILSTCPNHLNLPFFISVTMSEENTYRNQF